MAMIAAQARQNIFIFTSDPSANRAVTPKNQQSRALVGCRRFKTLCCSASPEKKLAQPEGDQSQADGLTCAHHEIRCSSARAALTFGQRRRRRCKTSLLTSTILWQAEYL